MTPEQAAQLERLADDGYVTRNSDGAYTLNEKVPVEVRRNHEKHNPQEFQQQIDDYSQGLNDLTYGELEHNRAWFEQHGADAQRTITRERRRFRRDLGAEGYEISGQDALHGPDAVLGGRAESFSGVGDSRINRSIGAQMKNQAEPLHYDIQRAFDRADIPPELHDFVRPNVKFQLVDAT